MMRYPYLEAVLCVLLALGFALTVGIEWPW